MAFRLDAKHPPGGDPESPQWYLTFSLPDELAPLLLEYYAECRLRMFGDITGGREARALAELIREKRLDMPPDRE